MSLQGLCRKMLKKMKKQPLLFVELLFWKTRRECHYINVEYFLSELGHLKKESANWNNTQGDEEIGSSPTKVWTQDIKNYLWDGLNCTYPGNDSPTITTLNLSSSGLSRKIDPSILNLTMLENLDLSNNSLKDEVPDFLSQLQHLKILDKLDVIKGFAPTSSTNSDKDDHNGEQLMEYESQRSP